MKVLNVRLEFTFDSLLNFSLDLRIIIIFLFKESFFLFSSRIFNYQIIPCKNIKIE